LRPTAPFREGTLPGGLPYLVLGFGPPLVYLCGWTPTHRNAAPGPERWFTLRTVRPLADRGFEVFFVNRWPGMGADVGFAELAERHGQAIRQHFGGPVDVLGHSTGGSLVLQLIADRPDVVRRAVVASAAYRLGPVAKRSQLRMLADLERTGRLSGATLTGGLEGMVRQRWVRRLLAPVMAVAARAVSIDDPSDAIVMLRAEDAFDVRDRLSSIPTETLVVCGARDYYWTPEMFAETAYRMPRGRLIMYLNRGHALVAAPEFVRDVVEFLRE
jgi:pimeloyl-ACP methyl ester carboxylesterase